MNKTGEFNVINKVKNLQKLNRVTDKQVEVFSDTIKNSLEEVAFKKFPKIADLFCGSGFAASVVLKSILSNNNYNGVEINLVDRFDTLLCDSEKTLHEIVKHNLQFNLTTNKFQSILNGSALPFNDNYLDAIVIKMGLHEVNTKSQSFIIQESYRCLKPNGSLIIWDNFINDELLKGFNYIVTCKDELMNVNRNTKQFFSEQYLIDLLKSTNFSKINTVYSWTRIWNTLDRYMYEFHNKIEYLIELNKAVDKILNNDNLKLKYNYNIVQNENNLVGRKFEFKSGIVRGIKA